MVGSDSKTTTSNYFIDQSRQDLASGLDPSIILSYARYHIGALQNLMRSEDRDKNIAQVEEFAIELEGLCNHE